jgi:hypothetical protein
MDKDIEEKLESFKNEKCGIFEDREENKPE